MSEAITITEGSGNVFADLGFDPAEAEIMKLRAEYAAYCPTVRGCTPSCVCRFDAAAGA